MNTSITLIVMVMAAIIMVPQSFAVTAGFGGEAAGGSVGSVNTMSLGSDSSFRSNQVLSMISSSASIASSLHFSGGSGSWVNQSHQADSSSYHAAAYAYTDPSKVTSFDYSCTPSTTTTSASIAQDINAANARNLTFGGYAYNANDYAAVQISGEADSIKYHNEMSAGKSQVSARQSLSGTGCNLTAYSWAERGNRANENLNHAASDILNTSDGFAEFALGPIIKNATYEEFAEEEAQFENATISSYSSQASLASGKAASIQSANLSSADSASFEGLSMKGTPIKTALNRTSIDYYYAQAIAQVSEGKMIKYTGSASSSSTGQSAAQRLDAASNVSICTQSVAGYLDKTDDPDNRTFLSGGYSADQRAALVNTTTGKNGYQSSASIKGTTAAASQSADISYANGPSFSGDAESGKNITVGNVTNAESLEARTTALAGDIRTMTYSAKSTVTSASRVNASSVYADQTLNARSNLNVDAEAKVDYSDDASWDFVNRTGRRSSYDVYSNAILFNAALSKKGYQSSAYTKGAAAVASQSEDISSASISQFRGGVTAEMGYFTCDNLVSNERLDESASAGIFSSSTTVPTTYSDSTAFTSANQISASSLSAAQTLNTGPNVYISNVDSARYDKETAYGPVSGRGTTDSYDVYQQAYLQNATLGRNGYKSSLSIAKGATIADSESIDILYADDVGLSGSIGSGKETRTADAYNSEYLIADTTNAISYGKGISYSAKSILTNPLQIRSSIASATQALNVKSAYFIQRGGWTEWQREFNDFHTTHFIYNYRSECKAIAQYPAAASSMSGRDTISVSGGEKGSATASQSITASSGNLNRYILVDQSQYNAFSGIIDHLLHAEANTTFTNAAGNGALSSLSGQSAATINVNTSASLSGSWKANLAKELATTWAYKFERASEAYNNRGNVSNFDMVQQANSKKNVLSISFKESAYATNYDAIAA